MGFGLEKCGAVAGGEQGEHLLDLRDLLRGTAEEAEEGFAERLAEDAKAGEGSDARGEVRVAAPGERVGKGAWLAGNVEVAGERRRGVGRERRGCGPEERAGRIEREADDVVGEEAEPGVVGLAVPAEGLAAVEDFGEDGSSERTGVRERLPRRPLGRRDHLAGLDQRKLCSVASSSSVAERRSSFQATG